MDFDTVSFLMGRSVGGGGGSSDPYPGWDVVIRADTYGPSGTYEYVKGSFSDLHDKLASDTPSAVAGLFVICGNPGDGYETARTLVFSDIFLGEYGTEIYLTAWSDDRLHSIKLDAEGIYYNG